MHDLNNLCIIVNTYFTKSSAVLMSFSPCGDSGYFPYVLAHKT